METASEARLGVGERVRVQVEAGQRRQWRRGIVALVRGDGENDEDVVEVVLDGDDERLAAPAKDTAEGGEVEEVAVEMQRVRRLEQFEDGRSGANGLGNLADGGAKERAEQLARLGDFRAARQMLIPEARRLTKGMATVGATVVCYDGTFEESGAQTECLIGTVDMVDDATGELEVASDRRGEVLVKAEGAVAVPGSGAPAVAFVLVLLSMTKYAMQAVPPLVSCALESASVALCVAECLLSEAQEQIDATAMPEGWRAGLLAAKFDLHMLKTRAHVLQHKYRAAAVDVRAAVLLRPADARARQMVKVIKQRSVLQTKQNKALVKNVSKWLDQAMREADSASGSADNNC